MESKVYIANSFVKDHKVLKCNVYKIVSFADSFSVTYYFSNTKKEKITVKSKTNELKWDWLFYSPEDGLILDGFGIGINVLNLDEETYKKINRVASIRLMDIFNTGEYDNINQISSNKHLKYENGRLSPTKNANIYIVYKR